MNTFYTDLKKALETSEGDIWVQTFLDGEHRGEKRLLGRQSADTSIKMSADASGTVSGKTSANLSGAVSCQEGSRVYCERIGRTPKLIVCGGGHVSIPIIQIGKMLGFTVTVIEDRPKFANHARAAGADQVLCEPFVTGLSKIRGDMDSWFVVVTRGHRYDSECLEAILKKPHAYAGMMGSRRRVAIVKDQLEEKGISREILDAVHTPIGLKIGAETPEEIAVSVMAEIIQVKSERKKRNGGNAGGYSPEILSAMFGESPDREDAGETQKVLATIISRKGSAPRGTGTKMLVLEDGRTIDTIGGGCIESEIIQKALLMMRRKAPDFQICKVDMTAEAAEDEGMVCGGVVEVMLERIPGST